MHVRTARLTRGPVARIAECGRGAWLGLSAVATLLLLVPIAPSASAQDDWNITRPGGGHARPTGHGRPGRPPAGGRNPAAGVGGTAAAGGGAARREALIVRYTRILDASPAEAFALTRLLDLYRERDGNIDGFVRSLSERADADASAYAPRLLLGRILASQGRLDDARARYAQAVALAPTDPAPLVAAAELERGAGRTAEAQRLYDAALGLVRDVGARSELVRSAAEAALDAGDFEGAARRYAELSRGRATSVFVATEYARALLAHREWARAADELRRVLARMAGDNRVIAPILRDLARAQLETGAVDEAIATLDRALRVAGDDGIRRDVREVLLEAYRRADRLPELVRTLSQGGARSFEDWELLGRLQDETGDGDAALVAYRRALALRPRDVDTRLRVVQLLSRSGRMDEVVREYRALVHDAPGEVRFVTELGQLLADTGRRDEALALLEQTSRRMAREPRLHRALAELYARWGDQARAQSELAVLARLEPSDAGHLVELGAQQLATGDREAALATWRRILTVESDRPRAHLTLAGVYADHDMLPDAIREYREAARLSPDDVDVARGLASALERQRADDEAATAWRRVLELAGDDRPTKREARQRIVAIWARMPGALRRRATELERAFGATPPDLEAGHFLAEIYARVRPPERERAERILVRLSTLEPGDVETLLALERVRTESGDREGALGALERLVAADPRRARTYLDRMAEHALALYRDEDAIRFAARAVELNPDDARAHERLGELYAARQDAVHAIASYRRAIELDDRRYDTHFALAALLVAQGSAPEADRLYRRVMRGSLDDDLVGRAARASIQLNVGADTLEQLEHELLPLALGNPQRPLYRRLLVELYDALARPLIRRARGSDATAAAARERLRRLGTRALKPLLEALADDDPMQRSVAIDVLGEVGNPAAAVPLIVAAETATDPELERRALLAAGAVGTPTLVARFATFASGPERRLRDAGTWALARIGGRAAVAVLTGLLRGGDSSVRVYAALGLGRARDEASVPALEALLREDARADVQAAAAWALGRIRSPSSVLALATALRARSGLVPRAAAGALGAIGDPRGREALGHALFDSDPALRDVAASALSELGPSADRAGAELPTPDPGWSPSEYVARLVEPGALDERPRDLARLRTEILAAARDALGGAVEQVSAALALLGGGSRPLDLGPLTKGLDSWPEPARASAARELDALADALLPDLVAVAGHPDPRVRAAVLPILARLDAAVATGAVLRALADAEPLVVRAALDASMLEGAVHAPEVAAALEAMLRDAPDWATRARAARALGGFATVSSREALETSLRSDGFAFVRAAAAEALGTRGDSASVGPLEASARGDAEPEVRVAAQRALGRARQGAGAPSLTP